MVSGKVDLSQRFCVLSEEHMSVDFIGSMQRNSVIAVSRGKKMLCRISSQCVKPASVAVVRV